MIYLFEARQVATRLRAALGELSLRASHDGLTGLADREQIVQRLDDVADVHRAVTVLYADLDHFKPINDGFGHGVGDELVLAVDNLSDDAAAALSVRLRTLVREPITTTAGSVFVDVSIGWAHSDPGERAMALLKRADIAMYDSKRSRRRTPIG